MSTAPTTVEINGFALRHIRKNAGIEVAELAERIGVQRPYVTKIELGHSQRVSPKVFNAILSTLVIEDRRALLANPHGVTDIEQAAS